MIYQYECTQGHTQEITQSIHDEALTECHCGAHMERVITGGYGFQIPKTLGSFADLKTAKMGQYERQAKPEEDKTKRTNMPLPKGMSRTKIESGPTWWRKESKPDTSLAKLTPEQQERYIHTGKK